MPLRDHFRPPVNDRHHWSELHGQWPGEIVRTLFDILPPNYQAGPRVYLGSPSEVDVSVRADAGRDPAGRPAFGPGGTATLPAPAPTLSVTADLSEPDAYEVLVYDAARERRLVAAIEIVSPANKDRPAARESFVGKAAALLRQDVCVTVVDVVSVRQANLYAELLAHLGRADPAVGETPTPLYAVTLRARRPPVGHPRLDAWFAPLTVGDPLPTLPLWLGPDLRVDLPLEPGYREACRLLRIA